MTTPSASDAIKQNATLKAGQAAILGAVSKPGAGETLKHAAAPPKSTQALLSDVRKEKGDTSKLHHTDTSEKRSLLSEVRKEHGPGSLKEAPSVKTDVIKEVIGDAVGEGAKLGPAVASATVKAGRNMLKESKEPVQLSDVMSDVRAGHGGKDLNHTGVPPKSGQAVLSAVRSGENELKHSAHGTSSKQDLLSEIRSDHGGTGTLKETQQMKDSVVREALSDVVAEGAKIAPVVAGESLKAGAKHLHAPPAVKGDVIAEVIKDVEGAKPIPRVALETLHAASAAKPLHHTKTAVKQDVLSEVRKEHGVEGTKRLHEAKTIKDEIVREAMGEMNVDGKVHSVVAEQSIKSAASKVLKK